MAESWQVTGNKPKNNPSRVLTERQQRFLDLGVAMGHLSRFAEGDIGDKCSGCRYRGAIAGDIGAAAIDGIMTPEEAEAFAMQTFDNCSGAVYDRTRYDATPRCPTYERGAYKGTIDALQSGAPSS
ncbi:hypothetical protein IPM09_00015 [Candidatus Saccharibacteria bacterium]|nr:MAG: hypothetical protein IPM09_00015 [Candidatus Saccharibacteria bacterium]